MRIPKRLQPLIEEGLIDEVVRPITSGKEAEVFVVWASGHLRAAKVYKEATNRTFKNRADYLDGRKTRGSRDERALKRGGKFAKGQEEETWQTTELQALGRLRAAGVRVPEPRGFMDGVLIMDLVLTLEGEPAPRLADCGFTADEARELYSNLVNEVQRMLCVGIVHGDLSEYNVLLAPYGPVIIDFPQVVDAAASRSARRLLLRDLGNIRAFAGKFAPELLRTRYAEEMWALYENAALTPDTALTGLWRDTTRVANVDNVREAIADAERDHLRMRSRASAPRTSGGPPPNNARGPRPGPRPAPNDQGPRAEPTPAPRPPRDQGPRPAPPQPRDVAPPSRDAGPRPTPPRDPHPRPPPPRDAGPRPAPPRDPHPRPATPRDAGPRPAPPRDAHPRPATPRDTGPRPAPPRDPGPRPAPPRDAAPRPPRPPGARPPGARPPGPSGPPRDRR